MWKLRSTYLAEFRTAIHSANCRDSECKDWLTAAQCSEFPSKTAIQALFDFVGLWFRSTVSQFPREALRYSQEVWPCSLAELPAHPESLYLVLLSLVLLSLAMTFVLCFQESYRRAPTLLRVRFVLQANSRSLIPAITS